MTDKKDKQLENALTSLKVEGMYLTEEELKNVKSKLEGKITQEEFLRTAREIAKKGRKNNE